MCWFQTIVEIIVLGKNAIDKSELLAGIYRKKSAKTGYCLSQEKSNNYLNLLIL